jgi:hypothetical protein
MCAIEVLEGGGDTSERAASEQLEDLWDESGRRWLAEQRQKKNFLLKRCGVVSSILKNTFSERQGLVGPGGGRGAKLGWMKVWNLDQKKLEVLV